MDPELTELIERTYSARLDTFAKREATRTRRAQGLGDRVTDAATLAAVAGVMRSAGMR